MGSKFRSCQPQPESIVRGGVAVFPLSAHDPTAIHKNARTTPRSRGQIVARVVSQQESPATVATAVGVSERTVRKWVARYAAEAEAGVADRPGRPHREPGAAPPVLGRLVGPLAPQGRTAPGTAPSL